MAERYYPLDSSRMVTSPYGMRDGWMHWGTDFGREGGSAGMPVYAAQAGTVVQTGAASGYGGPSPAGWVRIDHSDEQGGGQTVYGHVVAEVSPGDVVQAGQRIAHINPNSATNGGVAPHLHFEVYPWVFSRGAAIDAEPWLAGALEPGGGSAPTTPPPPSGEVIFGVDVSRYQNGFSLAAAKNEGMQFVIISTGDGDISDPVYQSHFEDAQAAGMPISAYHFLRRENMGSTIAQQVSASLRAMGDKRAPVWLDCENESGLSLWEIQEAKRLFEEAGVRVLGIYATASWWESKVDGGEPPTQPLGAVWVAHYGQDLKGPPGALYDQRDKSVWGYPLGDQTPVIWQFGQRGVVNGYEVDVNAFRGSVEQLQALFYSGTVPQGGNTMSLFGHEQVAALNDAKIAAQEANQKLDRLISLMEYVAGQLGPWPQLGQNSKGENLTLVDGVAAARRDIANIQQQIQIILKGK